MRRTGELGYVLAAGLVAGWAFHEPSRAGFNPWELLAFVMTLPAAGPGAFVLYVVGPWLFALSDTPVGTDWAVAVGYGLLFAAFAAVNVVVLRLLRRRPAAAPVSPPA